VELLEKETFYYRFNNQLIEPIHCAFFKEEVYQGYNSHQEAVLAFLMYSNRACSILTPKFVPGLKEKLDQVPKVEVTLSPEVEARIEAGVNAHIEAEIAKKRRNGRSVDLTRYEELKQELKKVRKRHRKRREESYKEFPQLYELTVDAKLIYTEENVFDSYKFFPIRVNLQMMQAVELSSKTFFSENGEYELAFRSYLQVHRTKENFWRANEILFPVKDDLIIYQWNTDFTNFYNGGREDDGAYLWSIYDRKKQQFTVIDIELIIP
jgi:hypothetical protein